MLAILDTGFLFALANSHDIHHERVLGIARGSMDALVLPVTVLPEICYLLDSRLGHAAMRQFLSRAQSGSIWIESLNSADLLRVIEILHQYADARVDFVDASIMALAERLNITRVLTIDQTHFRLFRPRHCAAFEILP